MTTTVSRITNSNDRANLNVNSENRRSVSQSVETNLLIPVNNLPSADRSKTEGEQKQNGSVMENIYNCLTLIISNGFNIITCFLLILLIVLILGSVIVKKKFYSAGI
jgi:hypothetical protein